MVEELKIGGLYRHYKGNDYIVRGVVRHSETLEELVLYECLYENPKGKLWVRPIKMFQESVVVDGQSIQRFRFVGERGTT